MNRKPVARLTVPAELPRRATHTVAPGAALLVLATLAACSGGGAPTTVNQQSPPPGSTANAYTGPAPANADVQAFKINLWDNIRPANRCGGCHHQGGQSPMFARSDDVNLAYQAAGPLVNLVRPDQSTLVLKVGSGHNCWVADPSACAATMLVWIQAWIGAGSASTTSVQLTAPPVQAAGGGKQFPADPTAGNPSFQTTVYPLLTLFCSGCHTSSSATAQQPYFASPDINEAYAAAQPKMNLASPDQSRFYVRLADEFHHCWVTQHSGGAPDCPGSSAAMLAQITAFANGIPVTPIDPNLVISNALTLKQGTVAAGGSRFEANLVAKYMFQTGSGSTAYDTSGVTPAADLSLSGNVSWVGGWGIDIGPAMGSTPGGKAQASTSTSQKLAAMIQSSGEYSLEVWVAPANVAQTAAYIVSYSGSNTTRNATLGQQAMQYEGRARSSTTDTNGAPPLMTTTASGAAQAALQHVVLTYDPVNGQKIYVNGVWTGDADPAKGGSLANWDSTFALVLGNETTGQRQWQGVIKFVAIHNRALTPAQIQQNFAAATGQLLSALGTVIPVTLGPTSDLFFLAFDQLGSHVHAYVEPTATVSPPAPDPTPRPDFGVATFERVNNSLARITGVPITNPVVSALYNVSKQSLPAGPLISAFLPSQQTAMSQLANAYCGQLLATQSLRDTFFGGTGLDASLNAGASGFFGASGSANRLLVINALVTNAVGTATPASASAVRSEVDSLLTRIPTLNAGATVSQATLAACTAVLGSAVVTLQ